MCNTPEYKERLSNIMKERYKDPEERKKTAEATKKGMEKMTKEQLSRRSLCKTPTEILLQIVNERYLTQKELSEKYCVSIELAKGIKSGKHWIYKHMKENNIPVREFEKVVLVRGNIPKEILFKIVKDNNLEIKEIMEKYKEHKVTKYIAMTIKDGSHWIYEYIRVYDIKLD